MELPTELTEQQKQHALEWYDGCDLAYLLFLKQRIDYAIQDRILQD